MSLSEAVVSFFDKVIFIGYRHEALDSGDPIKFMNEPAAFFCLAKDHFFVMEESFT
jgi:hypothetical protein